MLPLRTRVDQKVMAVERYSEFPKLQNFWNLIIRLFSVIYRALGLGVTLQQRCSRYILQPHPTRQLSNINSLNIDIRFQVSNTNELPPIIWLRLNSNNLRTVLLFKVFLSNPNNYIVPNNYTYLIMVICLYSIIWFQVTNNDL